MTSHAPDVADERTRGPAAGEYRAASYPHRDNDAELSEQLADAAIRAGFERDPPPPPRHARRRAEPRGQPSAPGLVPCRAWQRERRTSAGSTSTAPSTRGTSAAWRSRGAGERRRACCCGRTTSRD